ncbi:TadE/TadG family type IV pilus assembly protein [Erwinia sp. JUb26]|uniref:TadE/TadG family type IV pilus assembly protein n=1 Tax=Erwinia sp. JUb26 TaxID=2485126 RepID=UPI000F480A82|nr:hypothetical protein [Erwinia sp. JUb26]ROR15479.1 hypothetical protein EC836_101986 [Erwinia sp. JUb26]
MTAAKLRRLFAAARSERGVIATELAFLAPVVLVGVMMLFELARIGLVIGIGSVALDNAVQSFRLDTLESESASDMADSLRSRMVKAGYGYISADDLSVSVLHFDSLSELGGLTVSDDEQGENRQTLPVWSVTVQIKKEFLSPLPEVLSLGNTFRYQYKHVFGTELNDE